MQGRDITPKQLTDFLNKLKLTSGNVSKACQVAQISRNAIYEHKKENAEFSEAWDDVIEFCVAEAEQELFRRAIKGTTKPLLYKGEVVKTIKEYSDRLLEFYLKSKRPEIYRERMDINQNVSGSLPMNVESEIDKVYGAEIDELYDQGDLDVIQSEDK